jgi:hypothetical protein
MLTIRDLEAAGEKKMEMARGIALCNTPSLIPLLFATSSKEQEGRREAAKGEKKRDGASSLSLKFRHLSRFLD